MADDTVAEALNTALNVSAVTTLATGGIWQDAAKQKTPRPYLVFRGPFGRPTKYTLRVKVSDDWQWQLDAYADDSATADAIIAAAEAALFDSPLPVQGKNTLYCRKQTDLPASSEYDGQKLVHRRSQQWRIEVS
jgi:Protein of unknown function (DUF3168)